MRTDWSLRIGADVVMTYSLWLRAASCGPETTLAESAVLSTFESPTMAFVIPVTVPVKAGLARGAVKLRAVYVMVGTVFAASAVLSTEPKPTMASVIPATVPVKAGLARGAFSPRLVVTSVPSIRSA